MSDSASAGASGTFHYRSLLHLLTTAPLTIPTKAQGIDVQVGRDRGRYDDRRNDYTVGIGPGGVIVGPRHHCRTVTTRIERDDGRMITRRERRCD